MKGACYVLGMKALLEDFGVESKINVRVKTDSSAAKGFCTRRGLGKQRHVSTRYLWLQDKVARGEIQIVKVDTKGQLADCLTKATAQKLMQECTSKLGLVYLDGRSAVQKGALVSDFYTQTNGGLA